MEKPRAHVEITEFFECVMKLAKHTVVFMLPHKLHDRDFAFKKKQKMFRNTPIQK